MRVNHWTKRWKRRPTYVGSAAIAMRVFNARTEEYRKKLEERLLKPLFDNMLKDIYENR